ncbi:MAG TPA: serine protease [Polyangiaceae bacterium]
MRIHVGARWGTGVVFENAHTVLTSYELVNVSGELRVVVAGPASIAAKVVAWSKADDLAVLDLERDAPALPLVAATEPAYSGLAAILLYQPRDSEGSFDKLEWNVPIPRFCRVGRVSTKELDMDLASWALPGEDGAPLVDQTGKLIAMLSAQSAKERRAIATPIDRAKALLHTREKQGTFSPETRIRFYGGLFVTPLYDEAFGTTTESRAFLGAGLDVGLRVSWLFLGLTEGIFRSDHRRLSAGTTEALDRFRFELQGGPELDLGNYGDLFLGPTIAADVDTVETSAATATNEISSSTRTEGHIRPGLVLGYAFRNFFIRDIFGLKAPGEARLELGLQTGR